MNESSLEYLKSEIPYREKLTLQFKNKNDWDTFLYILGIGMIDLVNTNQTDTYEERKMFFDSYVSIIEQILKE